MAARRHRARIRRHGRRERTLSAGEGVGGAPRTAAPRFHAVHRRAQADLRGPDQPRIGRSDRPVAAPLVPQRRRRCDGHRHRDAAHPRPGMAHRRPGAAVHRGTSHGRARPEDGQPETGRLIVAVYEFPTSFGQRRMWLLAEMDPGEPTYNTAWALWLDGPLDVSALRQAWDAALIRHETLRTTFRNDSGVPGQEGRTQRLVPDQRGVPGLPQSADVERTIQPQGPG